MPKLLDRVRSLTRLRHYSRRTEQANVCRTERFIRYNDLRHPSELGHREDTAFLSHPATEKHVAASTRN